MKPRHVVSTVQFFDRPILKRLFVSADTMRHLCQDSQVIDSLRGKIMASVFYEPSTRTRFSFEAAMQRLGGMVLSTEAASIFSSAMKGETLEDTIQVVSGYADVIVLRHPEKGSAERASSVSPVPVINAGDGLGEHPTQALLDIYTIKQQCGRVEKLKIALIGDLLNGRTIHSLLFLLGLYPGIQLYLVSPPQLGLPAKYRQYLKRKGVSFTEVSDLDFLDESLDVLYVTRVQKERFKSQAEYEKLKHYFVVGPHTLKKLKPSAVVMHPLPRVGEIHPDVDSDPRAAYFQQAQNGLYVRMALLQEILA